MFLIFILCLVNTILQFTNIDVYHRVTFYFVNLFALLLNFHKLVVFSGLVNHLEETACCHIWEISKVWFPWNVVSTHVKISLTFKCSHGLLALMCLHIHHWLRIVHRIDDTKFTILYLHTSTEHHFSYHLLWRIDVYAIWSFLTCTRIIHHTLRCLIWVVVAFDLELINTS